MWASSRRRFFISSNYPSPAVIGFWPASNNLSFAAEHAFFFTFSQKLFGLR
jgi:hypothetical protein